MYIGYWTLNKYYYYYMFYCTPRLYNPLIAYNVFICIQLYYYYVSFHTVYKMFVYYIAIHYGCVMSTYLPDSMTLINLFHIYIIFYFIFHYALKNATLPNYCRHNDPRFINRNSIKLNLLKFKCFNDLLHPPICPSCCFREQIYGRVHISILVFFACIIYLVQY